MLEKNLRGQSVVSLTCRKLLVGRDKIFLPHLKNKKGIVKKTSDQKSLPLLVEE